MPVEVQRPSEEALVRAWGEFLRKRYTARIREVALEYPRSRSIVVGHADIEGDDQALAEQLLGYPAAVLAAAETAIAGIAELPLTIAPRIGLRVNGLPERSRSTIPGLRAPHLGKLVAIPAMRVEAASDVYPALVESICRCLRCDALIQEPQQWPYNEVKEPRACYEEQGGCGQNQGFVLSEETSRFTDQQRLEVSGADGVSRSILIEDDLCGLAVADEVVTINAIPRAVPSGSKGRKNANPFDMRLHVIGLEVEKHPDNTFVSKDPIPRDGRSTLLECVRAAAQAKAGAVTKDEIVALAGRRGITEQAATLAIERLMRDGWLLESQPGLYLAL